MTETKPSKKEIFKAILRSKAFEVLLIFWACADIFIIGIYGYGALTNEWAINLVTVATLIIVLLGFDIGIIPIWIMASIADDFFDPSLSVWDDKEKWK